MSTRPAGRGWWIVTDGTGEHPVRLHSMWCETCGSHCDHVAEAAAEEDRLNRSPR